MKDEKVVIVKAKAINPRDKKNKDQDKTRENQRESFNMKDSTSPNSKITKIQDKNVNGNYGRIYIQEGQKKNLVYSEFDVPESSNRNKLRGDENNTKKYNKVNAPKTNPNKRAPNSVDKKSLRRKSIERGDKIKNIQITHIIDSAQDIDFNITDPLVVVTEENKKKYRGHLTKNNRNGKNGKVKVVCTCSCDNVKIRPKEKKKMEGKTQVVTHRENPHLKRVNVNSNNNNNKNKINNTYKGNSYTMTTRQKNSNKPLNRNERK